MTLHNDAKLKYGTRVITDIDYVTLMFLQIYTYLQSYEFSCDVDLFHGSEVGI